MLGGKIERCFPPFGTPDRSIGLVLAYDDDDDDDAGQHANVHVRCGGVATYAFSPRAHLISFLSVDIFALR